MLFIIKIPGWSYSEKKSRFNKIFVLKKAGWLVSHSYFFCKEGKSAFAEECLKTFVSFFGLQRNLKTIKNIKTCLIFNVDLPVFCDAFKSFVWEPLFLILQTIRDPKYAFHWTVMKLHRWCHHFWIDCQWTWDSLSIALSFCRLLWRLRWHCNGCPKKLKSFLCLLLWVSPNFAVFQVFITTWKPFWLLYKTRRQVVTIKILWTKMK